MVTKQASLRLETDVSSAIENFTRWLDAYGETSWDHQSYFAGPLGAWAKGLYYRNRLLGSVVVAPMVFSEAFFPSARRLFHRPIRLPIADAHYAMGYLFLYETNRDPEWLERALRLRHSLKLSRCARFREYCWGYPFDWVTRDGMIPQGTPLITTTPYAYEAFLQASTLCPSSEWLAIMQSIVRHVCTDIKDFQISEKGSTCSYTPHDRGGVINAAAYRAFLLLSAADVFANNSYRRIAERNLNFVLEQQNSDGSWPYATDGVRDFVDHFHTCFIMKALAKIHKLSGHSAVLESLRKAVTYYRANLFAADGLPRPFARAPRLTVYKRELYDCAECVNLCLLLRKEFPELEVTLNNVVRGILSKWIKSDGSFRSRQLMLGWDNVPMHRWGQSQMFRSLTFYLREAASGSGALQLTCNN